MKKQTFLGLLIIATLLSPMDSKATDTISTNKLKRTAHMAELDTKLPQTKNNAY